MDIDISEIAKKAELMDDSYYYYLPDNFSETFFDLSDETFCESALKPKFAAVIVTSCIAIIGAFLNCVVIGVSAITKEYKKSWQHWLLLQVLIANTIFLFLLFLQTINETHGKWMMGIEMCKISYATKFTGHFTGVVFLVILNIHGIVSRTRLSEIFSKLSPISEKIPQLLISALIVLCVWLPCSVINIPLYKYSVVNDPCQHCALEFPIEVGEICPLLGWNETICRDMMNFFEDEKLNTTGFDPEQQDDLFLSSGDQMNIDINNVLDTNYTHAACKFDEPKSFYLWLFAVFGLFYLVPIPIVCIFCCLRLYDVKTRNNKPSKNKISTLTIIVFFDIVYYLCWTPWNVIYIRKASGGIYGLKGSQCESLEHYARFSTLVYSTTTPILYALMTKNIRDRLMTSFSTPVNLVMQLFREKEKYTSELNDISTVAIQNGETSDKAILTASTLGRNTSPPATFV